LDDEVEMEDNPSMTSTTEETPKANPMAKMWWLNFVRGGAALLLGLGLLLELELVTDTERLRGMLIQFLGIYMLASGLMSLAYGRSNRKGLGLWLAAGILGIFAGLLFLFRPSGEQVLEASAFLIILGVVMAFTGLIHIFGGFRLSERLGRRWTYSHVFLGILELILAVFIFLLPSIPLRATGIVLGIWGLVAGIGLLLDGYRMWQTNRG
jgi:uncharacterized membrane protein HdeD (DUF308 family)